LGEKTPSRWFFQGLVLKQLIESKIFTAKIKSKENCIDF